MPPGRYQVTADKDRWKTVEPKWVEVGSGRTTEVEVILEPAGGEEGPR